MVLLRWYVNNIFRHILYSFHLLLPASSYLIIYLPSYVAYEYLLYFEEQQQQQRSLECHEFPSSSDDEWIGVEWSSRAATRGEERREDSSGSSLNRYITNRSVHCFFFVFLFLLNLTQLIGKFL